MAKYTKPDYAEQWASAGNIVAPNSVKIQTGHIVEKPNYEYMNWIQNRQDTGIAYSLQMGIVEWDNSTQYQYTLNSHASYVQRNGVVYKAIQTGINKDPLTETAYWSIAFDDKGSAAAVQSNLSTHITNYGTLAGLTNPTTARTNLDVYSKAEAAQKNGDATKLFNVANGTSGSHAVNKGQLDTVAGTIKNDLAIVNLIYPVGIVIDFSVNTNPNTIFTGTTWDRFAGGKVTVGFLSGDADFGTIGQTGGKKGHKMTLNNLIEHDHETGWETFGETGATNDRIGNAGNYPESTTFNLKTQKTGQADPTPIPTLPPYVVTAKWVRTA